jgi:intracellular sulfur oxidation DsrE/DsrF family protein
LLFSNVFFALADDYDAMKGVDSTNVFFDMRDGIPNIASSHLALILETYEQLSDMKKKPVFVVVFMGGAAKLISSNRSGFSSEDQKYLDEIADTITKMSQAGIHLEVCLAAVKYFNIAPASIQSEIKHVPNGWISEIGYQARGYQLVPVY